MHSAQCLLWIPGLLLTMLRPDDGQSLESLIGDQILLTAGRPTPVWQGVVAHYDLLPVSLANKVKYKQGLVTLGPKQMRVWPLETSEGACLDSQCQGKPSPSHWHRKLVGQSAVRLDKPCVSTWAWASLLSRFLVTAAWKLTGCWSPLVLFRVSSANFNSGYIHILLCQLPGNSWGMAPSVFSF